MAALFLPFTPNGKKIELRAIDLKQRYDFGPYELIEPEALAERMGAAIIDDSWFDQLPQPMRDAALSTHQTRWSAGSITVDGTLFILANPMNADTRRSVTLLEELVHHGLGHPKSKLVSLDGTTIRTCQHDVEDEAYSVATALLMPYQPLFNHVNAGRALGDLRTLAPVSQACREYRVKRAGLWKTYLARGGN
jgi:Zn-dependent peptidase ImmA (M78 family)